MTSFVELSASPSACVLAAESVTADRFDSSYYLPRFLRDRDRLESLPHGIRDFREICAPLNCGATPKRVVYAGDGMPLIRTSNIRPNLYDASDVQRVAGRQLSPSSNLTVLPGDILYTMSGSVGFTAVYPEEFELASCSNTIARARVKDTKENDPYYIALFLNSSLGMSQSQRLVSGGILGHVMPNFVKRLRILLPKSPIQHAIGHKVRAAERLRAVASSSVADAVARINQLLGTADFSGLKPNPDGACDYFSGFVLAAELGLFHGAQFFAPKRKRAVALVKASGIGDKLGSYGRRVRAKGKQKASRGHVDPANVSAGDGYWFSGGSDDGGDVVLAKPGQTLFLRMRPYLNKTTINDTEQVVSGSPEFLVYEFGGLDAYYATLCFRQPWALAQVAEIATGDRPRVDGEFVDEVVVPWPDEPIRHEIGQLYQSIFALRRRADRLVQQAIADVEALIDGSFKEDECLECGCELAKEFGLEAS